MQIKYLGHASFFIKTKDGRIVTDPFDPKRVGLEFPKVEADIVTTSHHHPDHDYAQGVEGAPLVVEWPGEYEKNGIRVFGYKSYHDKEKGKERGENILYKIEAENISILHCGDMGVVPDDALVDEIGEVDILLVPVGGFYTIDAEEALAVIKHLEPSLIIPMHYNRPELDQEIYGKLTGVDEFLKKYGAAGENIEPVDQLVVKKEDLTEEMKLVVMNIGS